MRISFSRAQKIATCGRQYFFSYEQKLASIERGFSLVYGKAIDIAVSDYIRHHALGLSFDIVAHFEQVYRDEVRSCAVQYPNGWDEDQGLRVGIRHAQLFPEIWDRSNFTAVIDSDGKPVVQRAISVPLEGGDELFMVVDVVVLDMTSGAIAPLDVKTTSQALKPDSPFGPNALQLTTYQYGVDCVFSGYMGEVSNVGFLELVKKTIPKTAKGTGPQVLAPRFYPRRRQDQIQDMLSTYRHACADIRAKRFHRATNNAFNSPCDMCEFSRLCVHGDMQGLIPKTIPARP